MAELENFEVFGRALQGQGFFFHVTFWGFHDTDMDLRLYLYPYIKIFNVKTF
jgi:hypothetical protein